MRSKSRRLSGVVRGLSLTLAVGGALAQAAPLEPRVLPRKGMAVQAAREDGPVARIVIKFREGTHVRLRGGSLRAETGERDEQERALLSRVQLEDRQVSADLDAVHRAVSRASRAGRLTRLFSEDERVLQERKTAGELRGGQELADLNLYLEVPLAADSRLSDVARLVAELDALPSVETAYAEPPSEPAAVNWSALSPALLGAADIAPTTQQFESAQGYLQAAPLGVDAQYAWTLAGGTGAGVKVVDVEGAWRTTHEDLPAFFFTGGNQIDDLGRRNHGTAVAGTVVGVRNAYGVTGIAHGAQFGYASIGSQSTASAITQAASAAGVGGVVLLEVHRPGPADSTACTCNTSQCNYIAVEYWQADFDAIQTATRNGVTVVEAAGNGSADLDDAAYGTAFKRSVRDSGAIVVGAASATKMEPMCWTNYGSRVDVHGWGEQVVTLGYGDRFNPGDENQYYTSVFSGTSSASPIVTGSVACIQGVRKARGLAPLTSTALRDLLTTTGSAQASSTRKIGPRPNIKAALDKLNLR